jgi:hypothetical protein
MRRLLFGIVLAALGCAAISAQTQKAPPLQRIIEKPLTIHAPTHPCGGDAAFAVRQMGVAAGVLTGVERLPGRCAPSELANVDTINLQGMTVEAALNKVVEIDPRFAWHERNGVIVMRPVSAWTAADNPLNLEMPAFSVRERNIRGAVDLFLAAFHGKPPSTRPDYEGDKSELMRRKFSATTRKGTALDALDDMIRAHGAVGWMVSYTRRPASADWWYVSLYTFEGIGILDQPRDTPPVDEEEIAVDTLQRIVDNDFELLLPLNTCSVPAMVGKIVKRHEVPAGIEYLPERCPPTTPRGASTKSVALGGMTVAAALDKMTALDPRFRWVESSGLALVRPVSAWGDDKNVLNFTSTAFEVKSVNLDEAMSAVVSALQPRPREALGDGVRTNQGSKPFSVKTGPTSVGGALDAIIRAHGEGWWEVQHFNGGPGMRMLGFHTFDGSYIRSLIAAPR